MKMTPAATAAIAAAAAPIGILVKKYFEGSQNIILTGSERIN